MPRNLRNFWVELECDGYAKDIARGPQSRSGSFSITVNVASHGEPMRLLRVIGQPLPNGRNRVILDVSRKPSDGEWVQSSLMSPDNPHATLVLEEDRECKCLRTHDDHKT